MKTKKWLAMLLVGVLATSCLAGCGDSASNGKGQDSKGKKTIEIKYWKAGLGEQWLTDVIAGFEDKYPEYKIELLSSSGIELLTSAFGLEDTDTTDLYLGIKKYDKDKLEPLDDVLDATADGDTKTIREKFSPYYLSMEKAADGKTYNLTYGGGLVGIVYNKKMYEEAGIVTVPRTTDELVLACESLVANGDVPFCHFAPVGYWETFMPDVFFAQYDGLDYVMNNFYACVDEQGNSPSLDVFTKKDGRYKALEVLAQLNTPEYVLEGSSTYDYITMQTKWLQGEAAMMVTGSWIEGEMSTIATMNDFEMMKTPVVSSITEKLTTVKTDKQLREVISAIDSVTNGDKEESAYKQGENYAVGDLTVSAEDWNYVKAARNTMCGHFAGNSAYIPNYADQIEGAKEFLKYLYSDEGYKIYTKATNLVMPLELCEGELDTDGWSPFELNQLALYNSTEQFTSDYLAGKHEIFISGGATRFGSGTTYVDKFCTKNVAERMTVAQAWDDIIAKTKDNYENVWIKNIE